jgi:hypothetical protein
MTQIHPIIGIRRSTTMSRKHFISTVALAAAFLALSVSAAQAGPVGLGYNGQLRTPGIGNVNHRVIDNGYHGMYGGQVAVRYLATQPQSQVQPRISPHDGTPGRLATANGYRVMSPSVDPANAQQVPVVVTQAQPVTATDSGFNWTAAILGAGIASAVLLLAGATASRMKPRRVAL